MSVDISTIGIEFDTAGLRTGQSELRATQQAGDRAADGLDSASIRAARGLAKIADSAAANVRSLLRMKENAEATAALAGDSFNALQGRIDLTRTALVEAGSELARMKDKARGLQAQLAEALRAQDISNLIAKYRDLTSQISDTGAKAAAAQQVARSAAGDLIAGNSSKVAQIDYKAVLAESKAYETTLQRQQVELAALSGQLRGAGVDLAHLAEEQLAYAQTAAFLAPIKVSYQETVDAARQLDAQVAKGQSTLSGLEARANVAGASLNRLGDQYQLLGTQIVEAVTVEQAATKALGAETERLALLQSSAAAQAKAGALLAAAALQEEARQTALAAKAQSDLALARSRPTQRLNAARDILGISSDKDIAQQIALIEGALKRLQDSAGVSYAEIQRGSAAAKQKIAELRGESEQSAGAFGGMRTAVIALSAAFATLQLGRLVGEITSTADAYTNLTSRLGLVAHSAGEVAALQTKLYESAQANRAPLKDTVDLYATVAAAAGELGASQSQLVKLTAGVSASLVLAGRTATEASGALLQLGQLFGGPVVQAQEFNSLIDNMRPLLVAVAKNLDGAGGSVAKLKLMVNEGKVATSDFFAAAVKGADDLIVSAQGMQRTVGQALTQMRNDFELAVSHSNTQAIIKGIDDLKATVNDPKVQEGIVNVANSLLYLTKAAIETASWVGRFAVVLGDVLGSLRTGPIDTLADRYHKLGGELKQLEQIQGAFVLDFGLSKNDTAAKLRDVRNEIELLRAAASKEIVGSVLDFLPKAIKNGTDVIPLITGQTDAYTAHLDDNAKKADTAGKSNIALAEASAEAAIKIAETNRQIQESQANFNFSDGLTSYTAYYDQLADIQKTAYAKTTAARAIELAAINSEIARVQSLGGVGNQEKADALAAKAEKVQSELTDSAAKNGLALAQIDRNRADALKALRDEYDPATKAVDDYIEQMRRLQQLQSVLTADQFTKEQERLGIALNATLKAISDSASPASAAIKTLQEENAAIASGTTLEQYRTAERLRAQGANKEQIAQVQQLAHEQKLLQEAMGDQSDPTAALQIGLDRLKDTVVDLNDEWGKFTATAISGLDNLVKAADLASSAQAKQVEAKAASGDEQIALLKQASALQGAATENQLRGYAQLASGAAGFFGESSKGYKALMAVSQAFYIAELANNARRVASELAVQGPKAVNAVLSALAAPFPVNFAAGAAMAAIVAGLGVAVSGGGGSSSFTKPDTGTGAGKGTVLGDSDALSKSLDNSLSQLVDLQDKGLYVSTAQLDALRAIQAGINGVGNLLFRQNATSGGATPFDIAGTKTPSRTGTFVNNSLSTYENVSYGAQLLSKIPIVGDLIGFGNSIISSAISGFFGSTKTKQVDSGILFSASETLGSVLAGDLDAVYYATIQTTKKKYYGLSKSSSVKDVTAGLGDSLSNQISDVIGGLGSSVLDAVQILGGDVAAATAKLNALPLGIGKISLEGLKPDEVQDKLTAVFGALGDKFAQAVLPAVGEFQKAGEGLYETLVRVSSETAAFDDLFGRLGVSLNGLQGLDLARVAENLIDMSGGLDTLSSSVNDFIKGFYSDAEQASMLQAQLGKQLSALNLALPDTRAGFRALVTGLDVTTDAGQRAFATLLSLSGEVDDYYKAQESALKDAYGTQKQILEDALKSFQDIAAQLTKYRSDLNTGASALLSPTDAYNAALLQFNQTSALAAVGDQAALGQLQDVGNAFLKASQDVNASGAAYFADLDKVRAAVDTAIGAANFESSLSQQQLDVLQQQVGKLIDIDDSVKSLDEILRASFGLAGAQAADAIAAPVTVITPAAAVPIVQLPAAVPAAAAPAASASNSSDLTKAVNGVASSQDRAIGVLSAGFSLLAGKLDEIQQEVEDIQRKQSVRA